MRRLRSTLVLTMLLALLLALAGCGSDEPDPSTVLDRALTRENLSGFGDGPEGPTGGVVSVESLGYEDRVLDERQVGASAETMAVIREALATSGSGLRGLVDNLDYDGSDAISGVAVDHVSGDLEKIGLARSLTDAGAGSVKNLAGVGTDGTLQDSLAGAEFDLYSGQDDGVIRRLDLTLAIDDPDNALPPTRIRFSLTPDRSGSKPE